MAEYSVGSLGNLISGVKSKDGTGSKIVYQAVAPEKRKSTLNKKGSKVRKSIGALLGEKKPEIAGDEPSGAVGKSWKYLPSKEGLSDVDGASKPRPEESFSRNAARRITMKNNLKRNIDDPDRAQRTVFVGNIPLEHSKKIKKVFADYGEIESVRLRCAPVKDPRMAKKVAVINGEFHPQRSNINAYIVYKTVEGAKNSLQKNRSVFYGHHLRVDMANSAGSSDVDPRKSVFIGNLSFSAEEDDLWNMFSSCGSISSVRIVRDPLTAVSKGVAFINFESADAAELALQMDGEILKKREISVKRYKPNAVSSAPKQTPQGKTIRHKGASAEDQARQKENNIKDNKRAAKKEKRRQRRELEKINQEEASNADSSQAVPVEESVSEIIPKKTKKVKKEGDKPSTQFQGQRVDKSKNKKKKVNLGELKKKKVIHLLGVHKKKKIPK